MVISTVAVERNDFVGVCLISGAARATALKVDVSSVPAAMPTLAVARAVNF